MKSVIVLALIFIGAGAVTPPCPTGWTNFEDKCYFVEQTEDKLTYDEAKAHCQTLQADSDLVAIETTPEFEFLQDLFLDPEPTDDSNGWMTSGKFVDGVWIWESTGEAIDLDIFDWGPNDPREQKKVKKACLLFMPKANFKMSAAFCSQSKRQFICEMAMEMPEPEPVLCREDWFHVEGKCYFISSKPVSTFDAAWEQCKGLMGGSILVSLETEDEEKALVNYIIDHNIVFTAGQTSAKGFNKVFTWQATGVALHADRVTTTASGFRCVFLSQGIGLFDGSCSNNPVPVPICESDTLDSSL